MGTGVPQLTGDLLRRPDDDLLQLLKIIARHAAPGNGDGADGVLTLAVRVKDRRGDGFKPDLQFTGLDRVALGADLLQLLLQLLRVW